jgi:hypothetical protein
MYPFATSCALCLDDAPFLTLLSLVHPFEPDRSMTRREIDGFTGAIFLN